MTRPLSERPGSNRRHSAWKADALPTELLSHSERKYKYLFALSSIGIHNFFKK